MSQKPKIHIDFLPGIITFREPWFSILRAINCVPAYPNPTANKDPILTIKFSKMAGSV